MQSSDRLNFKKNNIEVIGKIDALNKKMNSIKSDVENLKETFKTHITLHKKSIKELYAFCNKLEDIYFNGLNSNTNLNSNLHSKIHLSNAEDNVQTESNENDENDENDTDTLDRYTISNNDSNIKSIYSTESTQYNNLFNC